MSISQTVFINIVVKGGNVDSTSTSKALSDIENSAKNAETGINKVNIGMSTLGATGSRVSSGMSSAQGVMQQVASTSVLMGSAVQNAEKNLAMLGTGGTRIASQLGSMIPPVGVINGALQNLGNTSALMGGKVENAIKTSSTGFSGFGTIIGGTGEFASRTINTLTKALISMVGVMIAWTAFITIPEMFAKGFIALAEAAAKAAAEMEKARIQLATVAGLMLNFGGSVQEQFAKAYDFAGHALIGLTQAAAGSFITQQEAIQGYRVFLEASGASLIKNEKEQYDTTVLLTSAAKVLGISVNSNSREFRDLYSVLTGIVGGGGGGGGVMRMLTSYVEQTHGSLVKFNSGLKESGTASEEYRKTLALVAEGIEKYKNSFNGIISAIKDNAELFNTFAMIGKGGALGTLTPMLAGVRDALQGAVTELQNAKSTTDKLTPSTQNVVTAFATLEATVTAVLNALLHIVGVYIDINDPAKSLEMTSEKIAGWVATLYAALRRVVDVVYTLYAVFKIVYEATWVIADTIQRIIFLTVGWVDALIPGISYLQEWNELQKRSEEHALALHNSIQDLPNVGSQLFGTGEHSFESYKNEILNGVKGLSGQISDELRKAFAATGENSPVNPKSFSFLPPQLQAQFDKEMESLQKKTEGLRADDNAILKIKLQQATVAQDMLDKYGKLAFVNQGMEAAIAAQTKLMIQQEQIKQGRKADEGYAALEKELLGLTKDLSIQDTLKYMEADRAERAKKLAIEYKGQTIELQRQVDLMNKIVDFQETQAKIKNILGSAKAKTDFSEDKTAANLYDSILNSLQSTYDQAIGKTETTEEHIHLLWTKIIEDITKGLSSPQYKGVATTMLAAVTEEFNKTADAIRNVDLWKTYIDNLSDAKNTTANIIAELNEHINSLNSAKDITNVYSSSVSKLVSNLEDLHTQIKENKDTIKDYEVILDILENSTFPGAAAAATKLAKAIRELRLENASATKDAQKVWDAYVKGKFTIRDYNTDVQKLIVMLGMYATAQGRANLATMLNVDKTKVAGEVWKQFAIVVADAMATMITAMVSGTESAAQAFRKFVGTIVTALGTLIMAHGFALMAAAFKTWPVVDFGELAKGLELVALGALVSGIGALMGGTGGSTGAAQGSAGIVTTPVNQFVNNPDVNVQQGQQQTALSINANTQAINMLNIQISSLTKQSGDVLVQNAIKKNPSGIVGTLSSAISMSYVSQKKLNSAISGRGVI